MKFIKSFLLLIVVVGALTIDWWTYENVTFTVTDAERVEETYLIYTDSGVYKNTDSWFYFKFDSSDLYNKLKAGGTFECGSHGFRNGFFSMYENLTSCTKL